MTFNAVLQFFRQLRIYHFVILEQCIPGSLSISAGRQLSVKVCLNLSRNMEHLLAPASFFLSCFQCIST
ncbi:hypothetical protein EVA_15808 [gut metagenome]|uniref:Uncharacterized protein n=1 Tax=gut metagenome TaxID=749906 RepID=J9G9I3_9ZZZZ